MAVQIEKVCRLRFWLRMNCRRVIGKIQLSSWGNRKLAEERQREFAVRVCDKCFVGLEHQINDNRIRINDVAQNRRLVWDKTGPGHAAQIGQRQIRSHKAATDKVSAAQILP